LSAAHLALDVENNSLTAAISKIGGQFSSLHIKGASRVAHVNAVLNLALTTEGLLRHSNSPLARRGARHGEELGREGQQRRHPSTRG
jgi:hypothetical protein